MKPRRKRLTILRIQQNSGKVAQVIKNEKQFATEEKKKDKIRKELRKRDISFVHNTGLKKLQEKLQIARGEEKNKKTEKVK